MHLAAIFAKRFITDVVQAILDGPVGTPDLRELRWTSRVRGKLVRP